MDLKASGTGTVGLLVLYRWRRLPCFRRTVRVLCIYIYTVMFKFPIDETQRRSGEITLPTKKGIPQDECCPVAWAQKIPAQSVRKCCTWIGVGRALCLVGWWDRAIYRTCIQVCNVRIFILVWRYEWVISLDLLYMVTECGFWTEFIETEGWIS